MKDYRINNEISSETIRIKDSNELISKSDALKLANKNNTDLIELSTYDNNRISICILQNYQKFLYQLKRREKELKSNQTKTVTKELRFGPQIDEHDYAFKLKHAKEFINQKAQVKACVIFKGREINFKNQGETLLLRLASDLEDISNMQYPPKLEGKRMEITLIPKLKK